ncbi:MAG: amidohydrolase family protein [Steroidobacteraceae bacterium]
MATNDVEAKVRRPSTTAKPIVCITADCHIGTFLMDWSDYLEPRFREEYQRGRDFLMSFAKPGETPDLSKLFETVMPGVDRFNPIAEILRPDVVKRQHEERKAFLMKHFGDPGDLALLSTGGEGNPDRQLKELEADGTVGGICLPQTGPFTFGKLTPELAKANAEAVNRWSCDFVAQHPDRHAGVITVSLEAGVDVAVQQIREGHSKGLRGGVVLDNNPELKGLPLYNARFWEPIWAVCAELGVVVILHAGAGHPVPEAGGEILWSIDTRWFTERPLRYLIVGGVFERHPNLKVIFIETNAAWAVEELAMLDAVCGGDWRKFDMQHRRFIHFHGTHDIREEDRVVASLKRAKTALKKLPSEYFASNVWLSITANVDDWAARETLGTHKLLWGSDYPHNESTWPNSMHEVNKTIRMLDVPDSDVRRLMGGNAAELWGFDLQKLEPVANRVGPVFN